LWPSSAFVNNKLYIIGGLPNNDSFYLDITKPFTVTDMSSMPWTDISTGSPQKNSVTACTGGANNNSIFVIGNKPSISYRPLVSYYDTTLLSWTNVTASSGPVDRYFISCANFGKGMIAIFSGTYITPTGNSSSDLWIFNTLTLTWNSSKATNPPAGRSNYRALTLPDDNILYIGGSYNNASLGYVPMNNLSLYNTNSDSWTSITTSGQTPPPRIYFSAVLTSDGRIIMFGGQGPFTTGSPQISYGDLWILNISNYQWSSGNISNPTMGPSNLFSHTADLVNNTYMFVSFGTDSSDFPTPTNTSSKIYILDISKNNTY
ncbi:11642_t:CDS:2, partial [Scutellospora calospora]